MARLETGNGPGLVICLTGPESTGKTTLAEALAKRLGVPLVPEVARYYLEGRDAYDREDLLAIAEAQLDAEAQALATGAPVVVADTDLTVIQVWWEEKYGEPHVRITTALAARTRRRYLLARPDIPWEADPLRESPADRHRLYARYRDLLSQSPFPFAEIGGAGPARLAAAERQTRRWLEEAGAGPAGRSAGS